MSHLALTEPFCETTVSGAQAAMVVHGEMTKACGAPPFDGGLELVDPVPAHPLLERQDDLQAFPAVRLLGAANMIPSGVLRSPRAAFFLPTCTAGNAERGIGREFGEQALEVALLEGEVGVELDDDFGSRVDVLKPGVEGSDDRRAPHGNGFPGN